MKKDRQSLERALLYYFVIICFVVGAIIGNLCLPFLQTKTILVSCGLLLIALLIMCIDRENKK